MPEKFKWGIIGPGRIAQKFADTVQNIPDGKIHAIASRSSEHMEKLVEEMHAERGYHSYEELVKDEEIDAIYVATPHRYHHENTVLCLENAKPALVEKAFTTNAREAEQLIKLAKKHNVLLMEAIWTRYMPIYQKVRQWIKKGKIGEVHLVLSTLGFRARRDPTDRLLNLDLAGGAILDLGVYNLAVSQFFFPDYPQSISAEGFIGNTGVDESVSAVLNYGNGKFAQLTCTFLTNPLSRVEVHGSTGTIILHPDMNHPPKATLITGDKEEDITRPEDETGFEYEILEAQRCVLEGKIESPLMTHQNSLDIMRMADEIRSQIGLRYPWEG